MCIIGKLWRKFGIEELLSPRGPRLVRALLRGRFAFVGVMSSLQALLTLHVGRCRLSRPSSASVECMHCGDGGSDQR